MSGISSSIGLISGINSSQLIDQLIALESRPLQLTRQRINTVRAERAAFAELNARLLALKNGTRRLGEASFFRASKATSSNADVLSAVARENAPEGAFTFAVRSLVSNHQLIARGLADVDRASVGAGTVSFEFGHGRLNDSTRLETLNGETGVRRGVIRITDRSGAEAQIDLTTTVTVDDVLHAINTQINLGVRADVSGDHIVLQDTTGSVDAALTVEDLAGGQAAADLGILGTAAGDRLEGRDINDLVDSTRLSRLNDGNGVRRADAGQDFTITTGDGQSMDVFLGGQLTSNPALAALHHGAGVRLGTIEITNRAGQTATVDLTNAVRVNDVQAAIEAAGLSIRVGMVNGSLIITDESAPGAADPVNLTISDVDGHAAADLGIAIDTAEASFVGNEIYSVTTIGDVVRAINLAEGNDDGRVRAAVSDDGNGITVHSTLAIGPLTIANATDNDGNPLSHAADDLGISGTFNANRVVSRDLLAGLNTVLLHSLNGGSGVSLGQVQFTAGDGTTTVIDFSGAQTVQDIVERINETNDDPAAPSQLEAGVNAAGNGIVVRDLSGVALNPFSVAEVGTGTTAIDLGIATGGTTAAEVDSGNLQLQYLSENTLLAGLNNGRGVRTGQVTITDSSGVTHLVDIPANAVTVGDVLRAINTETNGQVVAGINATGDGIALTDLAGGTQTLTVVDRAGDFAAADLRIAGSAAEGETIIDGSFEIRVEIAADDTLNDVARKLTDASPDLSAAVINDGSTTNPFRLTISSAVSGLRGRLTFDAGETDLALTTLVAARDAVVFLGDSDATQPLLVTSSSNTLSDVIPNVDIDLVGVSDEPVSLNITKDVEQIVGDLSKLTDDINSVLDRVDELTSFNSDTMERGVLLGDRTVNVVHDRLFRSLTGSFAGAGSSIDRLAEVGIAVGSGGRFSFDEERFREQFAANPAAVEQLFTAGETGVGAVLDGVLDDLTREFDGLLSRRDQTLESREEQLSDRADALQGLLDRRRERLQRQFQGLESNLAALQSQQAALAALQSPQFGQ